MVEGQVEDQNQDQNQNDSEENFLGNDFFGNPPGPRMVHEVEFLPQAANDERIVGNDNRNQPRVNAFRRLRQEQHATRPGFPPNLPNSMAQIVTDHNVIYKLNRFLPPKQRSNWPGNVKVQFSKRLYLFKKIKQRAERTTFMPHFQGTPQERQMEAAKQYDEEREASHQTLAAFYKHLKSVDKANGNLKLRKKRNGGDI